MPLQKIKRRIKKSGFGRPQLINMAIAAACVFAGYLIVVISDSTQEAIQEFKGIENVLGDVGPVKSIDELKDKVRNNPKILEKVTPSMIDKYKSNPLFKKTIERKLKELK